MVGSFCKGVSHAVDGYCPFGCLGHVEPLLSFEQRIYQLFPDRLGLVQHLKKFDHEAVTLHFEERVTSFRDLHSFLESDQH